MADYKHIIPFIKGAEGGLSKSTADSASKDPVPDGSGYHTNKGVTWTTFKGLASKLGYTATPALFYKMPDDVWGKIFKVGYWDPIKGDSIKYQSIADTLVDFAWGAGPGTAIGKLQDFLGLSKTNSMNAATLAKVNASNEKTLNDQFSAYKKNWYLTLPNQSANYKGWTNRLDALYKFTSSTVGKAAIGLVGIGIAAALFFLGYRLYKRN